MLQLRRPRAYYPDSGQGVIKLTPEIPERRLHAALPRRDIVLPGFSDTRHCSVRLLVLRPRRELHAFRRSRSADDGRAAERRVPAGQPDVGKWNDDRLSAPLYHLYPRTIAPHRITQKGLMMSISAW